MKNEKEKDKRKRKFNRDNSQGGEQHTVKKRWQNGLASSLSTVRKNESGTLDRKEQHGVNSTKRENNTNCLPEINQSSFEIAVASPFWSIESFLGGSDQVLG